MEDERVYSKTDIRERRRELSQLVALQQRQLAALAKMDEAADELDQVEREMADLASRGADPEQPAETAPAEPEMPGERAVVILRDDHPNAWCDGRGILEGFERHDWVGDRDPELLLQSLRHSLRRLALHHPNIERRTEKGGRHYYRYVTKPARAEAPSVNINGTAVPAYMRGPSDG
jgi:hypothetical protein